MRIGGLVMMAQQKKRDIEDTVAPVSSSTRALMEWWDQGGHRKMPWRLPSTTIDRDQWAYEVWVSEIMLQQTQVDRVIPYYERWVARWPTVRDLATASEDDVKSMWTGLGYYRRAKFLLEGARSITGDMPRSKAEWLKVKGVGPYTASAISSICYDESTPVVDGNVVRVLARHRAVGEDSDFWQLAGEMLDRDRAGDFNQAIMELGATVCTKANPKCDSGCPLAPTCLGKESGDPSTYYPFKKKPKLTKKISLLVCVVQCDSFFGIERNSKDAQRLAGLWQFPTRTIDTQRPVDDQLRGIVEDEFGGNEELNVTLVDSTISHSITDTRYTIHVAHLILDHQHRSLHWLTENDLKSKAASSILDKSLQHVKKMLKKKG